ncbi:Kelch-like protein 5 [Hordeum vulgare]|nr:Kelch-like protein 5 [Hordeum vulgare]
MPPNSDMFDVSRGASIFVPIVLVDLTATSVAAKAKSKKDGRVNNMKWLNKMCELISNGVRTDKGFKEVHLNTIAKQVFEFWYPHCQAGALKRKANIKKELEEIERMEEAGPLDPEIYEKTLLYAAFNVILVKEELF